MSNEIEAPEETQAPPPDEGDKVLRMLWPFNPRYFGIRVIADPADLDALADGKHGMTVEEVVPLKAAMAEGMTILMVEADIENHGQMLSIWMAALQASRTYGNRGAEA